MDRPLVLDTSAILSGIDLPPGTRVVAPDAVETEISGKGAARRRFEYLQEAGLVLMRPSAPALERVHAAARGTGDALKLSAVDAAVLALAIEMEGDILTDDYAIQNVAAALKIPTRAVGQRGIRAQWSWVAACSGCGKRFDQAPADGVCPVCGHGIRARRKT